MTPKSPTAADRRLAWFHQSRFGMFIHWGLYSIPARGEWVMHQERIPHEEYAPLAERFRPVRFDPDAWVALAKEAGMKYVVFTTRHHDGFSLFDSQVSDFTSVKTAAGRDFVADFVRACRRHRMKIGFYYSLLDWRFPAYFAGPKKDPKGWERHVCYSHAQVRELCTNYGKIDLLWYDGGWVPWAKGDPALNHTPPTDPWRAKQLNAAVRKLQPHILINNRAGTLEDFDTPEQHVAASAPGRAWESCLTMNDHWGYCRADSNWKSTTQLLHALLQCASGGGNLLLNVGPQADGSLPAASVKHLRQIGAWTKRNGSSIYDCGRSPLGAGAVGLTTAKGDAVFLHVLYWPGEDLCLPDAGGRVESASLLATGKPLRLETRGDRLFLRGLPKTPPDHRDTVIVLELTK